MGPISATFEITAASFSALRRNPRLAIFPVLSAASTLALIASFAIPVWLYSSAHPGALEPKDTFTLLLEIAVGAGFYFSLTFITVFLNAALTWAAMRSLEGEAVGVGEAITFAASRLGPIAGFSLVTATVSLVLRQIEDRSELLGKIVAAIAGTAWSLAVFLAVPVIVSEPVDGLAAVKRSAQLCKATWGEMAIGSVGLGILAVPLVLVLAVTGGFAAYGWTRGDPVAAASFGVLTVLILIGTHIVMSALRSVWSAALYRYATSGETVEGFPAEAFAGRPRKR
jgi:hypothetical protein